ncbi:uncharacterized protein V6R79_018785 [Siganus canaliculatus]
MSNKVHKPLSLLDKWTQENNELLDKWEEREGGDAVNQTHLRWCSSEFHKLLRKIQGIPPLADHTQLEVTVTYNACLFSAAQSRFSEAQLILTQAAQRVAQVVGNDPVSSDPTAFWKAVLKSVENASLNSSVHRLLSVQWALWLATCQLKSIQELQGELFSLLESQSTGAGDDRGSAARGMSSDTPLLVMDPKQLNELLQICTLISQGAEKLSKDQSSEALSGLQKAFSMSAPRPLVAYTHVLSGSCLAHMSRPQLALQCYRKALETDSRCVCALYQSMLIYRELGNTQAEIQALSLLHSTFLLPSASEPALAAAHILSPSILLCSQSLTNLVSVPSALSVLHNLARKCVLHGGLSEGVEYYLDLLAALHSDQLGVCAEVPPFPRLPELYLEAGAALLMVRRSTDCMVLCDEVISTTQELLPERVVLEEPKDMGEAESRVGVEGDDKVGMLLWAGAAYLLYGHCHTHLKDWKQAVTYYTRCINLLMKVHFKQQCLQPQIPCADMISKQGTNQYVLQRLKGLSLAGRGISFSQMDRLKEALRDLLLSQQCFPACASTGLWCGEVLWRLGRRLEAAAHWERSWSLTTDSSLESLPVYLQEPQCGPLLDSTELRQRVRKHGHTLSV